MRRPVQPPGRYSVSQLVDLLPQLTSESVVSFRLVTCLAKKPSKGLVSADFQMGCYICQDRRERSNAGGSMIGNCQIVFALLKCYEAEMATGLPSDG